MEYWNVDVMSLFNFVLNSVLPGWAEGPPLSEYHPGEEMLFLNVKNSKIKNKHVQPLT